MCGDCQCHCHCGQGDEHDEKKLTKEYLLEKKERLAGKMKWVDEKLKEMEETK